MSVSDSPRDEAEISTETLTKKIVQETNVHWNLGQDAIITTEDKVRLCLNKYLTTLERRKEWVAPAGVFIAIVLSFVTADFKNFYFDAATWRAVFLLLGVSSLAWLLRSLWVFYKTPTVDDLIGEMKRAGKAGDKVEE